MNLDKFNIIKKAQAEAAMLVREENFSKIKEELQNHKLVELEVQSTPSIQYIPKIIQNYQSRAENMLYQEIYPQCKDIFSNQMVYSAPVKIYRLAQNIMYYITGIADLPSVEDGRYWITVFRDILNKLIFHDYDKLGELYPQADKLAIYIIEKLNDIEKEYTNRVLLLYKP